MFSYTGADGHRCPHSRASFASAFAFVLAFLYTSLTHDKFLQQDLVFIHVLTFYFSVVSLKASQSEKFQSGGPGLPPLDLQVSSEFCLPAVSSGVSTSQSPRVRERERERERERGRERERSNLLYSFPSFNWILPQKPES